MSDLLIHITTAPTLDQEAVELGMACAAFEQDVTFVFSGNGLLWLIEGQLARRPHGKAPSKLIKALGMYDCDQVFFVGADASAHNIKHESLRHSEPISADQLANLQATARHILSF